MTFAPLTPPPLLTADLAGIAGRIKLHPEDFEVEEVPAYTPTGEGEHLYLWVEKRSMGTDYFHRQIARRLGIGNEDVGTAGLKDRHAVTRQWVSVPAGCEPALGQLDGDGIRVLSVSRHTNKLKTGHLRGNRFRILVRQVDPAAGERLPPLLDRLRHQGLPNFYGPQRFGRDGETLTIGLELLHGGGRRVGHFLRRFALSAVQSAVFNHHLATRMADGLLHRVLAGDVMAKWPFGGMFVAEDFEREQARMDAREIVPTGPIFGRKMFAPAGEQAAREQASLAEAGLKVEAFHGFGKLLSGTRRYTLVHIDDLTAAVEPDGVRLAFTLPAGSYATVLLRELTHSDTLEGEEAE